MKYYRSLYNEDKAIYKVEDGVVYLYTKYDPRLEEWGWMESAFYEKELKENKRDFVEITEQEAFIEIL